MRGIWIVWVKLSDGAKKAFGILFAFIYALVRIMVRRLAKLNILSFQASPKIITLIRFVQRASILAGITFAGVAFHGGSATAQTEKFCVVASNGKTVCGTLKAVERACVTADNGVVCGKFKSVAAEQGQAVAQSNQTTSYKKESGGVTYLLRNCKASGRANRSFSYVKCNFVLTVKRDNQLGYMYTGAGKASIIDSAGNTYASSEVLDYNGGEASWYNNSMSSGIDYVVDLYFPVEKQITNLSLLNVMVENSKVIQFRNIPVSN